MSEPIKLAASGNKTDKIAPPDLDCKIFFFLYNGVFLRAIALICFCEGLTWCIILGHDVRFFFKIFLHISEIVLSWFVFSVGIKCFCFWDGSLEKYLKNSLFLTIYGFILEKAVLHLSMC